jgi:hypothetical protein
LGARSAGDGGSNTAEVNVLELPKLPHNTDGTALWDWLKFLAARREEELKMLAEKIPRLARPWPDCKKIMALTELSREKIQSLLD